jgi:hypothetical protein
VEPPLNHVQDITAATLPLAGLGALADLRCTPGIAVVISKDQAWVTWRGADDSVLERLLPLRGARFYRQDQGIWYRHDSRLPASGVPFEGEAKTLEKILAPESFTREMPDHPTLQPMGITLAVSEQRREVTAILCGLTKLAAWADKVPLNRIRGLEAARLGDRVLVRGAKLPAMAGAERFWGDRVLLPLGSRLQPEVPASAMCDALGLTSNELLLWSEAGLEAIDCDCFRALSRASIKLALES